jgi:hypothetical protein
LRLLAGFAGAVFGKPSYIRPYITHKKKKLAIF